MGGATANIAPGTFPDASRDDGRLGNLGFPFNRRMPRQAENYARELRSVRNQWAHHSEFTEAEAFRAIDSAELLLRAIGIETEATQVAQLKQQATACDWATTPPGSIVHLESARESRASSDLGTVGRHASKRPI